jgi:hypothetical protein
MQWTHNAAAFAEMKELFGDKTWTGSNPFYSLSSKAETLFAGTKVTGASMNQMFAKKINATSYKVWGQIILSYNKSIREQSHVLFKCRYNKLTGALTQIELSFDDSEYASKTEPMKARRTGTVDSMFSEMAAFMGPRIDAQCAAYWKGFTAYYAEKTKNMCGYHLD